MHYYYQTSGTFASLLIIITDSFPMLRMAVKITVSLLIAITLTAGSLVANSQSLCHMKQCPDGVTLCYSLLKSTGFNETMLYNGSFTCKCEKLIFQKNSYNFSTSIIIENSSKITILGIMLQLNV